MLALIIDTFFFLSPIRCLSLVPHRRPLLSALDCWNTRRWPGCRHWRHVRTPSSMSCASRTPASPAGENFRPYSTSVPLVSMFFFSFLFFFFFFPAVCFLHRLSAVIYIVSVSLIMFSLPCSLRAVHSAPVELHTHSSSRSCTDIACITRYVIKWAFKNIYIYIFFFF